MSSAISRRLLAVVVTLLALAACVVSGAAADRFKAVTIKGGDQGALIIDIRDKQGVITYKTGIFAVASVRVSKKRWQRLVDAWHQAQAAAEEGKPRVVPVLKMDGEKRFSIEVSRTTALTFIEDATSRTFTLFPEDYDTFTAAIEDVLQHLED